MRVVSFGEVLWDIIDDHAFLGGAPLNVCANLRNCGDEAFLVSGIGDDSRGQATLNAMQSLNLSTLFLETVPGVPTGTAVVSRNPAGEPSFTINRPAAFDLLQLTPIALAELLALRPDWIYMGTLSQTEPAMEALLRNVRRALPNARTFYDLNLREGHWNLDLVERLCRNVTVLKLNEFEAATLSSLHGVRPENFKLEDFCRIWSERFQIPVICITLGPEGCCLFANHNFQRLQGQQVQVSDTVGAGDAFAAAFLHGYQEGWPLAECGRFANELGAFVASKPGATPSWALNEISGGPLHKEGEPQSRQHPFAAH